MTASQNLVVTTIEQLNEIVQSAVLVQLTKFFPKDGVPFAAFPESLTTGEVCEMCNVSRSTVANWRTDGRLKPQRVGRVIRYPKSDVIQLLSQKPKHKRV